MRAGSLNWTVSGGSVGALLRLRGVPITTGPMAGRLALLVGGGPAPGINGVISSVAIEAVEEGLNVIGFKDGFKWLVRGDAERYRRLAIEDVKAIHLRGGSILGTSRTNPA